VCLFDASHCYASTQGKPAAIARIRQRNPYNTVVMIGDGITDLEAVQVTGGADLFVGFGGVVERPAVAAEADWYIRSYTQLVNALKRYTVRTRWVCASACLLLQKRHNEFDRLMPSLCSLMLG
jgi:glycerol-3-phosphate dehydrogenase (NAD+)